MIDKTVVEFTVPPNPIRAVEKFNRREAETATLLSRCVFSLTLRGAKPSHAISNVR